MRYYMVTFQAELLMYLVSEGSSVTEIKLGTRASLLIHEKYFPSLINQLNDACLPGKKSMVHFSVIIDENSRCLFKLLSIFEIGDGPIKLLAQGVIVSEPVFSLLDI